MKNRLNKVTTEVAEPQLKPRKIKDITARDVAFIERHYHRPLSKDQIAEKLGINVSHVRLIVKKLRDRGCVFPPRALAGGISIDDLIDKHVEKLAKRVEKIKPPSSTPSPRRPSTRSR